MPDHLTAAEQRVCAVIDCQNSAASGLYCLACAAQAQATRDEIARRFPGGPLCDDCQWLFRQRPAGAE